MNPGGNGQIPRGNPGEGKADAHAERAGENRGGSEVTEEAYVIAPRRVSFDWRPKMKITPSASAGTAHAIA